MNQEAGRDLGELTESGGSGGLVAEMSGVGGLHTRSIGQTLQRSEVD
jgi:hypothetical protein